jgi:hypothetical protein
MPGQKGRSISDKDIERVKKAIKKSGQKGRSISDKDIEIFLAAGNANSRRNRQESG